MKKKGFMSNRGKTNPLLMISASLIIFLAFLFGENTIKPKTDTGEIEFKVRVFDQENPVIHLKPEDFKILEDHKALDIIGFRTVQKKLEPQAKDPIPSRLFLLFFNLFHNNLQVQKNLAFLFDNIIGENDKIQLIMNHKIMHIDEIPKTGEVFAKIMDLVQEHSERSKKSSEGDILKMDEYIDYPRENTEKTSGNDADYRMGGKIHRHYYMKYFKSYLEKYVEIIRSYNKKYLIPDAGEYSRLLANIEDQPKETWAFHFFQMAELPVLSKKNRALITKMQNDLSDRDWTEAWMDELDYSKKINNLLAEIDRALAVTGDFETNPIIDLSDNRDITFHSIFLKRDDQIWEEYSNKFFLISALIDKWKEISRKTGGFFIDLKEMASTLEPIEKTGDFYYAFTLKPFDQKIGKITVTLPNHSYEVLHRQPFRPIRIHYEQNTKEMGKKQIQLSNLFLKNKTLSFRITDFSTEKKGNTQNGRIWVRIDLRDSQNKTIYLKEKTLISERDTITISLDLKRLPEIQQYGTIEVTDLIFGMARIIFLQSIEKQKD